MASASPKAALRNGGIGGAAQMGLGYEALRGRQPQLVVCDICGEGEDGPTAILKRGAVAARA